MMTILKQKWEPFDESIYDRYVLLCPDIKKQEWEPFDENAYECRALLCPEEDGGYSAHALRLPGVVSQGESVKEALVNIVDAFRAAVSVYREHGGAIPWTDLRMDRPEGSIEKWILVHV